MIITEGLLKNGNKCSNMTVTYCNGLPLCYGAFDATTKESSVQYCGEHIGLYEVKYCVYNEKLKNIYEDFIKIGLLLCLCLQNG